MVLMARVCVVSGSGQRGLVMALTTSSGSIYPVDGYPCGHCLADRPAGSVRLAVDRVVSGLDSIRYR